MLPIAAAMPNHMPRTWRRRPRLAAGSEPTVEEASDDSGNMVSGCAKRSHHIGERRKCKLEVGAGLSFKLLALIFCANSVGQVLGRKGSL